MLFCELNEWNKHKQLKHVETVGTHTHLFLVVENGANVEGIKKHRFHWVVGFTFQNDDHSGKACGVGYKQHCTHPTKSSVVTNFYKFHKTAMTHAKSTILVWRVPQYSHKRCLCLAIMACYILVLVGTHVYPHGFLWLMRQKIVCRSWRWQNSPKNIVLCVDMYVYPGDEIMFIRMNKVKHYWLSLLADAGCSNRKSNTCLYNRFLLVKCILLSFKV